MVTLEKNSTTEVSSNTKRAEKLTKKAKEIIAKAEKAESYRETSRFTSSKFQVGIYSMTAKEAGTILENCNISYSDNGAKNKLKGVATNRTKYRKRVTKLKQDILNNDWFSEHADVSFDTEGMLINGQHTLSAIVEANQTVDVLLKKGCRVGSQQKIDVAKPRSLSVRLRFAGHFPMSEPDTKSKFRCSVAGYIMRNTEQPSGERLKKNNFNRHKLSKYSLGDFCDEAILKYHNKYQKGIEWLYDNQSRSRAFKRAPILAPIAAFYDNDEESAKKFYNILIGGQVSQRAGVKGAKIFNAATKLREMIIEEQSALENHDPSKLPVGMRHLKSFNQYWFAEVAYCLHCVRNNKTYDPKKSPNRRGLIILKDDQAEFQNEVNTRFNAGIDFVKPRKPRKTKKG